MSTARMVPGRDRRTTVPLLAMLCVAMALSLVSFARVGPASEPAEPRRPVASQLRELQDLASKEGELLRQMLASDDAGQVAWAAYTAGVRSRSDVLPEIVAALENWGSVRDGGDLLPRYLLSAVLDLRGTIPERLLLDLLHMQSGCHELLAGICVWSKSAAALAAWTEIDRARAGSPEWVALGSALLAQRNPEFASLLLGTTEFELILEVGQESRDVRLVHPLSSVTWSGAIEIPENYPPFVCYSLSCDALAGDVLLVDGVRPAYLRRRESEPGHIPTGGVHPCAERSNMVQLWMQRMIGAEGSDFWLERQVTLRWRGPADFAQRARVEQVAMQQRFWRMCQRLMDSGWLDPKSAALLVPRVRLSVRDARSVQEGQVPEVVVVAPENPFGK